MVATKMCGCKRNYQGKTSFHLAANYRVQIESIVPYHVDIIVPVNISCYISMEREIYMLIYVVTVKIKANRRVPI